MKLLVSACLLGVGCRYDGGHNQLPQLKELLKTHTCIPICPEQMGGLPTPRPPAERLIVPRMHRPAGGKSAVAPGTLSLMEEAGAVEGDMEDIAAFLGQIEGVETSVTIRELEDGACKLSVRTSGGLNATRVCALLGGGGHAAAAGCTVDGTLEQAEAAILDAIRQVENNA